MERVERPRPGLTGRIQGGPSRLLHEEILGPQFRYDMEHVLPWLIAAEKAIVVAYVGMGILNRAQAQEIGAYLDGIVTEDLAADRENNLSDLAFAVERRVQDSLREPVPSWHVDRSRNDLQACAQLMSGRFQLLDLIRALIGFGEAARHLAERTRHLPMPGYTHFQAAQVITPGFYLAAVSDQVLHMIDRLLATYDGIDRCPLGAGAMAGQELPWDRDLLARLLGFSGTRRMALDAVASRLWMVEISGELSVLGCLLSRPATDFLLWASSGHGFIDLPDELCGISSAMPQKKNYPVLERIRGRLAHLTTAHLDVVLTQRNTPLMNLVEVSKESGATLVTAFEAAFSALRLFTEVLTNVEFKPGSMREACEREYLGGFALANALTLKDSVPWRQAQIIAGRYIVESLSTRSAPPVASAERLTAIAAAEGFAVRLTSSAIAKAFDVDQCLASMSTAGSTNPEAVACELEQHRKRYARASAAHSRLLAVAGHARASVEAMLVEAGE